MRKLTELPMDTMLAIERSDYDDLKIMDVHDFLSSEYFDNFPEKPFPKVFLAESTREKFDLFNAIESICDGTTYDDCAEDVYNDVKDAPETAAFIKLLNEVFQRHPTYWEGEPVEVDIVPEKRGN